MSKLLLEVQDLHVEFGHGQGAIRAVDGVDLSIASKEIVALVGESGSGKTMTALALGGLLPSQARWHAKKLELEGKIAYIFQDPATSLNPVMTIEEQLLEPLILHRRMAPQTARPKAVEALQEVQLPDAAEKLKVYPHQLSGGMQQRVMLAMAILLEPALLIADEPTTALDVTVQRQILSLLLQLRAQKNLSVLLITHDLTQVAKIADRIAVMHDGKIVESGPTQQLLHSPKHPYTQMLLKA